MRKINFLAALLVVVLASNAYALDDTLFTTPTRLTMERGMNNGLTWDRTFKSVQEITFNSQALLNNSESYSIHRMESLTSAEVTFQVEGINYEAVLRHFEYRNDNDFSWFGKVTGSQFLSHFAVYNGKVAGEIWGPGGLHRSVLSRKGKTYLVEMDDNEIGRMLAKDQQNHKPLHTLSDSDPVTIDLTLPTVTHHTCPAGQVWTSQVDLLYVYDSTSLTWFGWSDPTNGEPELRAMLQSSVDAINATIENSKANSSLGLYRFHVNLVGREKVNYTSTGLLGQDSDWVSNPSSAEIVALSERYHPDVIALWVGVATQGIGGLAYYGGDSHTPVFEVNFVGMGVAVAVHEFGHTLDMYHQPEDPATPQILYRGHFVNGVFRDTMAIFIVDLCPNDCRTIPVFSNPNVLFDGLPTGIVNEREAWRSIGFAFSAVSQYQQGNPSAACLPK